jgi:hypothetical protein
MRSLKFVSSGSNWSDTELEKVIQENSRRSYYEKHLADVNKNDIFVGKPTRNQNLGTILEDSPWTRVRSLV